MVRAREVSAPSLRSKQTASALQRPSMHTTEHPEQHLPTPKNFNSTSMIERHLTVLIFSI